MARRRQVTLAGLDRPFKGRQFTAEVILWAVRLRIPLKSAGDSGLMSATHSDGSRPAVPIDVGRGGAARGLG